MDIPQEIQEIKERNRRVELDKAWETSLFRSTLVLISTYLVTLLTFYVIGTPTPYLSAIIPTLGFFLSTLSFPVIKRWWISRYSR